MLEEFNDVLHGSRLQTTLVLKTTRKKPATALCSLSFHGSRCGTTVKSTQVPPKKSGLSSSSISLNSKKEAPENLTAKKTPEKEIALDTASLSSAQEDEEEILKVESGVQVVDDIEESRVQENKEVHVEALHGDESGNVSGEPTFVGSDVGEGIVVAKENENEEKEQEEEERLINEDNFKKIEENKEKENNGELNEEVKMKIDEDETSEKLDIDMNLKEEKVKEEEESGDGKKREVVKGKKESPSAYNVVIAIKMQENPRKNKKNPTWKNTVQICKWASDKWGLILWKGPVSSLSNQLSGREDIKHKTKRRTARRGGTSCFPNKFFFFRSA
ncbi:hypothetical protein YC2023_113499 [Brassica napus]